MWEHFFLEEGTSCFILNDTSLYQTAGVAKLCNSVLQYPSSASLCILRILGVISHVHKKPALIRIVNQISPIHTLSSYSFEIYFNITLLLCPGFPNCPFAADFATYSCRQSVLYRTTFIPCLLADHINNFMQWVQIINFLLRNPYPAYRHFLRNLYSFVCRRNDEFSLRINDMCVQDTVNFKWRDRSERCMLQEI